METATAQQGRQTRGASTNLQKDSQPATCSFSADFVASEAPIANKRGQGLPAPPRIARKSFTGPEWDAQGRTKKEAPMSFATIIGFFNQPQANACARARS